MSAGTSSLSSLLKKTTIDDHEEIIRACNATLKHSKGSVEAQHAKVIALLKLDRYEDALHVFEESGAKLKSEARLEHAYALYKSGDWDQTLRLTKEIYSHRGARHLEAQASYRSENFAHAASLYKELSDSRQSSLGNEQNDLRINGSATDAQLEWKRQGGLVGKRKVGREDLEAFETAYNAACACIARGEFGQGEVLLKRAKDLCSSSDELSDSEKVSELLPISVQQLYILSVLGKAEQAEQLAAQITVDDVPDLSTRQIARINKLTTQTTSSNHYLSHRIFHSAQTIPKSDRFFEFQTLLISQNDLALDLLSSKYTGVSNTTSRYISNHEKHISSHNSPSTLPSLNTMCVANAAAQAQNQLGRLGLKSILPLLEKRPNDVGLILVILHLYIMTNNHGSAITVLESFFKRLDESTTSADHDVRFAPGLVAIMVSLYAVQGRKTHMRTELAKAAFHWKYKSKSPPGLMRAAGLSLLSSSDRQDLSVAGEIFSSLREEDPRNKLNIAGYIVAYATKDLSKVQNAAEQLTPISRLTAGIDVASLESAGVPHAPSAATLSSTKKRPAEGDAKSAKKRVRKSRLPKDYDPSKTADPERWVPLRDRSTYRPKGKKGKQKQAALTQGGVNEKGAEGLNISNSDGVAKPANTVISASSKQQKKKKAKK